MWQDLIEIVETYVEEQVDHSVTSVSSMLQELPGLIGAYSISRNDLPFGRYLIHNDPQERFNIQLDIFSERYEGSIHCHESWGLLAVMKGALICEQWSESIAGMFTKMSESFLPKGAIQTFCPPDTDWHKVKTASPGEQVVSIHIYGCGFNLEEGIYLDEKYSKLKSKRSEFKPLQEITSYIRNSRIS